MAVNLPCHFQTYYRENLRDLLVKVPSAGDEALAPATRLLEKRREAAEVHQAMEAQREEFELSLRTLRVRRDELREKEVRMKEYLRKFDNFLKDSEMKRLRAVRKAAQERELASQKQADLCALQEEMAALRRERDRLQRRVQRNACYPQYLERVVQGSDQFQEGRQVMSRYDTLVLTREDLLQTAQENQESTERARAHLARFTEQSNDTIMQYNNILALLQSKLDQARAESLLWESRWAHIQNTAAKKTLLLGTIKMATLNLYQIVCKRARDTGEEPIALEDTPRQLQKIQTYLTDLMSVWEELSKPDSQAGTTTHGSHR
ncbi:coiled-coil domain-containing protein 42-like isoform X1 [Lepisosteus oculatus]|uniref:coiled-coil domain-containing protein 42-like isoform X1 n=1 Tax=Lepisosteus oculatus TaxID=7918 RepID=UPI00371AAC6D